jgi:hypothetical protein
VIIGNAPLFGEAMGVTIVITQVHLPDVEVHELALVRSERHRTLLGRKRIAGVLLASRDVLEIKI